MVHLLTHIYPTDTAARVTADADAGMETVAAADATFHTALLARGPQRVGLHGPGHPRTVGPVHRSDRRGYIGRVHRHVLRLDHRGKTR